MCRGSEGAVTLQKVSQERGRQDDSKHTGETAITGRLLVHQGPHMARCPYTAANLSNQPLPTADAQKHELPLIHGSRKEALTLCQHEVMAIS